MSDTTKLVIKIASGVAVVVIAGVKIVMAKRENKKTEESTNEETTE